MGVCQSRPNYLNIMDDLGGNLKNEIKELLKTENKPRLVFDNFDFRVLANITLPNHRNSDMHWIAHFLTFDRIPSDHLDNTKPLVSDINSFDNKEYLLSSEELKKMKSDFIVLVSRVLAEFFPCLKSVKNEVTQHISHK